MCHFNQRNEHDRDQTITIKAIQAFDRFISSYPDSQYVQARKTT
jgi:outer membrane protein assembly factor BamD (BamD/ComL family)